MSEVRASARARRLCLRVGKSRVGGGHAAEYFGVGRGGAGGAGIAARWLRGVPGVWAGLLGPK